jgi:hypothetical protein
MPPKPAPQTKYYFYNQGGRKITVMGVGKADRCRLRGFSRTTADTPKYNPVFDRMQDVNKPTIDLKEINRADREYIDVEVI